MNLLIISLVLALIPLINFSLKYHFSSKDKELKLFKNHWFTSYIDWLFVPFNFLWIYTFDLEWNYLILFAIISLIFFLALQHLWIKQHKKERKSVYMFDIKTEKIKKAGYVELLFFTIESTLLLGFLFSTIISQIVYIETAILILFTLAVIPSSIKIHGKLAWWDGLLTLIGIICLVIKTLS